MKISRLIPLLLILFLMSCSEKTKKFSTENKFNLGIENFKPETRDSFQKFSSENKLNSGIENFKPEKRERSKSEDSHYADAKNIINLIKEKKASFIIFGIASDNYSAFEKKYGVKVKTENCVIMPNISKLAIENNRIISKYLSEKFQDHWKSDLKVLPFGLN